jgi:hypothetical protein
MSVEGNKMFWSGPIEGSSRGIDRSVAVSEFSALPETKSKRPHEWRLEIEPQKHEVTRTVPLTSLTTDVLSKEGIMNQFVNARMPSNREIEMNLESTREAVARAKYETPGLNIVGSRILNDVELIIRDLSVLLREKNSSESVQRLMRESQSLAKDLQAGDPRIASQGVIAGAKSAEVQREAQKLVSTLRSAIYEMASNPSFRRSLMDFFGFLSSLGVGGGVGSWLKSEPGVKSLEGGSYIQQTQRKASIPGLSKKSGYSYAETSKLDEPSVFLTHSAEGITATSQPSLAGDYWSTGTYKATSSENLQPSSAGITSNYSTAGVEGWKSVTRATTLHSHYTAPEAPTADYGSTTTLAKSEQLSDQHIDQLVFQLKNLMREIAANDGSRRVFDSANKLYTLLTQYQQPAAGVYVEGTHRHETSPHMSEIIYNAKKLVEELANGHSVEPMLTSLTEMQRVIRHNRDFQDFFDDFRNFFFKCIRNPEVIDSEETNTDAKWLINRALKVVRSPELSRNYNNFTTETKNLSSAILNDPWITRLNNDVAQLASDLSTAPGSAQVGFNATVFDQVKRIFLGYLENHSPLIALPRVHYEDDEWNVVLSNTIIALKDILPEHIRVENFNALDFGLKATYANETRGFVKVIVENIAVHSNFGDLWFDKKTFPAMKDQGKIKMDLGGRGLSFAVVLRLSSQPGALFALERVDCFVDRLKLRVGMTRHDWMYNMIFSMYETSIKKKIQANLENSIASMVTQLNTNMNTWTSRGGYLTGMKDRLAPGSFVKNLMPSAPGRSAPSSYQQTPMLT